MPTDDSCSRSRIVHARPTLALKQAALLLLSGSLGYGCAASSVERGAEFYTQRRYIDAAQVFEHNERRLPEWEADERAEYALYRGATLLALGNRQEARLWLHGAQQSRKHLSAEQRALLAETLRVVDAARAVSPVRLESASGLAATRGRLRP